MRTISKGDGSSTGKLADMEDSSYSSSNNININSNSSDSPQNSDSLDNIKAAVREDILGKDLTGPSKFFYTIDVWPGDQLLRAPKQYNIINAYFTALYYLLLLAYTIYALYNFAHQVPTEVNTMVSNSNLNPITVTVNMSCSVDYGCGNWVRYLYFIVVVIIIIVISILVSQMIFYMLICSSFSQSSTFPPQLLNPVTIVTKWASTDSACALPPPYSSSISVPNSGPKLPFSTTFQICYSP